MRTVNLSGYILENQNKFVLLYRALQCSIRGVMTGNISTLRTIYVSFTCGVLEEKKTFFEGFKRPGLKKNIKNYTLLEQTLILNELILKLQKFLNTFI